MGRLSELREAFRSKKMSPKEFYTDQLTTIKKRNSSLNAYVEVFEKELQDAANLQIDDKPLSGMPIAIKDMISIKGKELTACSRILKNYKAPRHATVVEKLLSSGAVLTGRTNCDEFAMGSSNETSCFGPVKNPFHLDYTPGGSSGGSAAAVAAEICVGSLGTDTGGSIREPASFCGIVGLKPTYGRVSRSGVIAFASSLDQVGPFADDALDCAIMMESLAGRDARDATTLSVPVEKYTDSLKTSSLKGLKIGLPKEFFNQKDGLEPAVLKATEEAIEVFKKGGAEFKEISLAHAPLGIAVYYIVATAEAASNLSRYDGIRYGHRTNNFDSMRELILKTRSEGFGSEVKRRIILGTFALSSGYYDAYYAKAQFVRQKIQNEYLENFKNIDLILTPVCPTAPFKIGQKMNDPLKMYLSDIFTVSVNLAGLPGIVFPVNHSPEGLPIGCQLIGAPFQEKRLLDTVAAFERAHPTQKGALRC